MEIKTEQELDDQLSMAKNKPVILYFGGTYCGPCKKIKPVVKEAEEKFKEKAVFIYIDETAEPECMIRYNIFSVPTIVFLKNGHEQMRKQFLGKDQLEKIIKDLL